VFRLTVYYFVCLKPRELRTLTRSFESDGIIHEKREKLTETKERQFI